MEWTNSIEAKTRFTLVFASIKKSDENMLLLDKQLLKFLLVGIANTLVGCGLMFILYNCFGISYWFSSACNYLTGGILSYFLNKYFTFQNKQKSLKQVIYFIVNLAICYFLAYFIAKKSVYFILSTQSEKFRDNVALLSGMCIYTALNYLGQRLIVFNHKENSTKNEALK